ncbi:importin subunit alpha-2 [Daphnia magna]|uniref:importin subunit alpha-2 n=1 Tax=Daphnia magna TaxID=35525 RepID=UPI0006E08F07|nr:importin subunit alpha-2 [Daphnia magna]XP_032794732.1 importin subunit alpha-2 [Daphnia magna]
MSCESAGTVKSIRDDNRLEFGRIRRDKRFQVTTIQRSGLEQLQPRTYSPSSLHSMATTLRKKKDVNREFLAELSQALMEKEQNAIIFCSIDGSVQGLCTFLTGGDSGLQLEAAYCIANAAAWEDENKTVSQLSSAAGAYLITLLGCGNSSLQEACCWALGNMLPQGKNILCSQGFVDKVLTLIDSPYENVRTSAVQCLVQFVSTSSSLDSDLIKISTQIEKLYHSNDLDVESLCWLNYLLSFFPCCDTTILVSSVIFWSLCQLRQQLSQEKKVSILVPIIRFLGNVTAASNDYVVILLNENDFVSIILKLLNSSYEPICKETLLLVANIVNNPSSTVRLVLANVKFKETLEKSVCNVLALF